MPGLYMWAFYPTYLIFVIPALIISIIAQAGVHSAYRKYSCVRNMRGMTGAEAAQRVLQFYGVSGVSVERVGGNLTDHFDPRHQGLRAHQDPQRHLSHCQHRFHPFLLYRASWDFVFLRLFDQHRYHPI